MKLAPSLRSAVLGIGFLALAGIVGYRYLPTEPSESRAATRPSLFDRFDRNGNGVARLEEVAEKDRASFELLLESASQTELGALTRTQFLEALRGPRSDTVAGAEQSKEAGAEPAASETTEESQAATSVTQTTGPTKNPNEAPTALPTLSESAEITPSSDESDLFARFDADGNGELSRTEFADLAQGLATSVRQGNSVQPASTVGPLAENQPEPLDRKVVLEANPMPSSSPAPQPAEEVAVGYLPRKLFAKLDKNGDQVLALSEIPRTHQARLIEGDSNADGRVSLVEFASVLGKGASVASDAPNQQGTVARASRRGGLMTLPEPGKAIPVYDRAQPAPPKLSGLPSWFDERDVNRDRQVAQSEWPQMALAEFRRVDQNRDGFISLTEAASEGGKHEGNITP